MYILPSNLDCRTLFSPAIFFNSVSNAEVGAPGVSFPPYCIVFVASTSDHATLIFNKMHIYNRAIINSYKHSHENITLAKIAKWKYHLSKNCQMKISMESNIVR